MSTNRIQGRDGVIIDSKKYLQIPVGGEADQPPLNPATVDDLSARKGMIRYNDDLISQRGYEGAVETTTLDQFSGAISSRKVEWYRFAMLDAQGKLTMAMLPESVSGTPVYKGTWNALTNDINSTWDGATTSIALPDPEESNRGDYYMVRVPSGATNHGNKHVSGVKYEINDWVISNGTIWERVPRAKLADVPATQVEFNSDFIRPESSSSAAATEATNVNGYKFKSFGLLDVDSNKTLQTFVDKISMFALDRSGDEISGTIRFATKGRIELTDNHTAFINVRNGSTVGIGGFSSPKPMISLVSGATADVPRFTLYDTSHLVASLPIFGGVGVTTGTADTPVFSFRGPSIDSTFNSKTGMYMKQSGRIVSISTTDIPSNLGVDRLNIGTGQHDATDGNENGVHSTSIFTAPQKPATLGATPAKPVYTFVNKRDSGMYYTGDTNQLVLSTTPRDDAGKTDQNRDSHSVAMEKNRTIFWKPVNIYDDFSVIQNDTAIAGNTYRKTNRAFIQSAKFETDTVNLVFNATRKVNLNAYDLIITSTKDRSLDAIKDEDAHYRDQWGDGIVDITAGGIFRVTAGSDADPANTTHISLIAKKHLSTSSNTATINTDDASGTIRDATTITGGTTIRSHLRVYNSLMVGGGNDPAFPVPSGSNTQLNGNLTVGDPAHNTTSTTLYGNFTVSSPGVTKIATIHADTTINGIVNINGQTNVTGNADIDGTLDVSGLSTLHSLTVSTGPTNITGDATLNNKLTVTGLTTMNGGVEVVGTTEVTGDLNVTGATDLDGTLNVDGDSTLKKTTIVGDVTVTGATNITGNTKVTGTFQSTGDVTFDSKLTTTGDVTFSGKLAVTGDTTLVKLNTTGDVTLGAKLNVTGNTALTGTLTVTSTSTFNDNVAIAAGKFITHPATPTVANHVANKGYVDAEIARLEALITALTARVVDLEARPIP